MSNTVDILMAVYNGSKFVGEQIESIIHQTYPDWFLIIQDDCSTDNTWEVVEQYAKRFPDKIAVKKRQKNSGAADKSFYSMLPLSQAPYVMFCDHDDVWLPQKIELTLNKMKELEQEHPEIPLLVHTDLTVVGSDLREQAHSMFRLQQLNPAASFRQLVVQNMVTGCTVMVNRSLLDLVQTPPTRAIMHDWWFALIASAFGRIGVVEQPTILYRQHGNNEVGAKDTSSIEYQVNRMKQRKQARQMLYDTCAQAGEFLDQFEERLSSQEKKMLEAYRNLPKAGKAKRIQTLFHYRLFKYGLVRKLGQIAFI